jgi:hypothetical protein
MNYILLYVLKYFTLKTEVENYSETLEMFNGNVHLLP